jgi:tetratricopeptide (TPR) repeat protein
MLPRQFNFMTEASKMRRVVALAILLASFAIFALTYSYFHQPNNVADDKRKAFESWQRGNAHRDEKEYDKAIAAHTEAIRLAPTWADPFTERGMSYAGKGEHRTAINDFSEAISLDPTDSVAFFNRAISWAELKEYDKAIADLTETIDLDPK